MLVIWRSTLYCNPNPVLQCRKLCEIAKQTKAHPHVHTTDVPPTKRYCDIAALRPRCFEPPHICPHNQSNTPRPVCVSPSAPGRTALSAPLFMSPRLAELLIEMPTCYSLVNVSTKEACPSSTAAYQHGHRPPLRPQSPLCYLTRYDNFYVHENPRRNCPYK